LDAVVDAIANGTAVPTEGDDIVNTMRVIDAVKSAAQKG
jgi:predicted dehydrogenase